MHNKKFIMGECSIYYLHEYYPTRFLEHDGKSGDILCLKLGYRYPVKMYTDMIAKSLFYDTGSNGKDYSSLAICIIPSHEANKYCKGLLEISGNLSKKYGLKDFSTCLVRHSDHKKLTSNGIRSIKSHLDTLSFNSEFDIHDKHILLIDDVTTTGNSMLACREILIKNGARDVYCLALAKTCRGTLPSEIVFDGVM